MDRALDLKPKVTQGCGFESRLRQEVHDCSPGAAQSAAHCSKCIHLDGLNAENTFHSSLYSVTNKAHMLHRCLVDGDGCVYSALSPEIHYQLLGLVDVQSYVYRE